MAVISTTLSCSSLICSFFSLLWFIFLSSLVIVLFISVWLVFIFSLFVKNFSFLLCASILFLSSLIIFMIITLNSFSGRLPISLHLIHFLAFYLVPSSGTCSSDTLFCLSCCLYFCLSSKSVTFPNSDEMAFCRRYPIHPSSKLPSCQLSYMF